MAPPLPVCIHGATGRMGRQLVELVLADPHLELTGAVVGAGSLRLGEPVPGTGLHYSSELPEATGVVIDFSLAPAVPELCRRVRVLGVPLVSGTTGLDDEGEAALDDLARHVPVLWAANFSLGLLVLRRLAELALRLLPEADVSVSEIHHRGKRDAPSGTARVLAEAVSQVRGEAPPVVSERVGGVIGEHRLLIAGAMESLSLSHRALDRRLFAAGALHAARWLAHGEHPPGRYRVEDVLLAGAASG